MARKRDYVADKSFTDLFPKISGNTVNGLGSNETRQASPFFWHPVDKQTHGKLQTAVTDHLQSVPALSRHFSRHPPGGRGPRPRPQASERIDKTAAAWVEDIKGYGLANEADLIGIAKMRPEYVYEGYEIEEPWVILIGVAMDYAELAQVPATFDNPTGAVVVAKEYNRAARACRKLANHILSQGYFAKAYQGPYASALNMIPAAIDAGLGELGKHGSMINREFGSSFRLSAVTTDLPLIADEPDDFGADDYCSRCEACVRACPPDAIFNTKQTVRGVNKWYVDFDKCIPYFGETFGCGICIARCPFSRPGNAFKLIEKINKKSAR